MNNDRIKGENPKEVHNIDNQTSHKLDEIRRRSNELTPQEAIEQTTTSKTDDPQKEIGNSQNWSAGRLAQYGADSLLRREDIDKSVQEQLRKELQENTDNTVEPGSSKPSLDSHKRPYSDTQKAPIEQRESQNTFTEKTKPEWEGFLKSFCNDKGKNIVTVDFDGTVSEFNPSGKVVATKGFIDAATKFLDKGHVFAVVTGRPIDQLTDALRRSGASEDFINRLEISGEYGAMSRGPSTKGKIKMREDLKEYAPTGQKILKAIQQRINGDNELSSYANWITVKEKALGGSIYRKGLDKHLELELKKRFDNQEAIQKEVNQILDSVDKKLNSLILDALKEEQRDQEGHAFCSRGKMHETGVNIIIDKNATGIAVSKQTAVESLVEMHGEVSGALAFGDGEEDFDMQKGFQDLIKDGSSTLNHQAFVGVKHDPKGRMRMVPEIENDSTAVVSGPKQAGKLLLHIADNVIDISKKRANMSKA